MKTFLQTLAVLLLIPLCACNAVPRTYAENGFDNIDFMQGIPSDTPILHRNHSIFGTMNF